MISFSITKRLGLLVAAAQLFVMCDASAGMMSPCRDPIVLPGPKVQVFIFPYRAESKLTPQGYQLATLMQRHVLFAALKYRSIGVEELTGETRECNIDNVTARISARLKDGQAAIFLSGRLFEQGQSIRLQSTVSFSVHGRVDTVSWQMNSGQGNGDTNNSDDPKRATATIPTDPVMFAAREIPFNFLTMMESAQHDARRLHKSPDASSSFWELPTSPDARFGFEVIETRNDWMHLRLLPGGGDGWVPAHALATGSELKGVFPELYFVDGLIGYHEILAASPSAENSQLLNATLASFDEYIRLGAGRAESEARALASILKGNATLRAAGTGQWSTEVLQQALHFYNDARQLAPTSTIANSFYLACDSALCNRGQCAEGADHLHTQFLNAIAQDPTSHELVDNLNAFYGAIPSGQIKVELSAPAVAEQRTRLKRAQSQMR